MLKAVDQDEHSDRVRSILERMSRTAYAGLPYPRQTAEFCTTVVERALRGRNSRAVREWIDYERALPNSNLLMEVFDLAVERAVGPSSERGQIAFAEKLRRDTAEYIGSKPKAAAERILSFDSLVQGVATAIYAADRPLGEHGDAVAAFTYRLGLSLGLSDTDCASIAYAARIHEIGKLGVPFEIRVKPMTLTRGEMQTMRQQLRVGTAELRKTEALTSVASIIEGALLIESGESVSNVECNILAVADVFHTLLLAKPYRKPWSPTEALEYLIAQSQLFDRDVVATFASMLGHRRNARTA